MKVVTWNINGINSRIRLVLDWCKLEQPDVLCLQETKCVDVRFPHRRFRDAGFDHVEFTGEKGYNGVAIISKFPVENVEMKLPGDDEESPKRFIAGDINGVRIVNVYVPHGTLLGSDIEPLLKANLLDAHVRVLPSGEQDERTDDEAG